jgi:SAM-dependent methyltransferase
MKQLLPDAFKGTVGRKPFRRANKDKRVKPYAPLEPFEPKLDELEVPEDFVRHEGQHPQGLWQRGFLIEAGLKEGHSILDIGCGDLREGVPLIRYLDTGNYVGVDQTDTAIGQGFLSLTEADLAKSPAFYLGGDFGFEGIGRRFDYAWAHSVWTHVDLSMVGRCMDQVSAVLKPTGVFMATVFLPDSERPFGFAEDYANQDRKSTYGFRNPFHHPIPVLASLAEVCGLDLTALPDKTMKRQRVLRMTPKA